MKRRTKSAWMWGWALATVLSSAGCFEEATKDWSTVRFGAGGKDYSNVFIQWTGTGFEQARQIDVASFGALTAAGDTQTDLYLNLSHPASRQLFVGNGAITPAPDFTSESASFAHVVRMVWKNFSLVDSSRELSTDADDNGRSAAADSRMSIKMRADCVCLTGALPAELALKIGGRLAEKVHHVLNPVNAAANLQARE